MNLRATANRGDQQHDFCLDNALLAHDDVLESVVELQSDQKRKNLAEHNLKYAWVEWIVQAEHQSTNDARGQAV